MKKQNGKQTRVIPGFGLTLGIVITMLSLIVLIPLASVLCVPYRSVRVSFLH